MAAFVGYVLLEVLLNNSAETLLKDWVLSHAWVKSYRNKNKLSREICLEGESKEIAYVRFHAEWLGLLAALWLRKEYNPNHKLLKDLDEIYEEYGGMKKWFDTMMDHGNQIMPRSHRRKINELVGGKTMKWNISNIFRKREGRK